MRPTREPPLRYLAGALMMYGAVGVAVHLRLLPLLASGLGSWFGLPSFEAGPTPWGVLGPLQGHFDSLPWLPWLAWLLGIGLLGLLARVPAQAPPADRPRANLGAARGWLVGAALAVLVLVAGYLRMAELWPPSSGISQFPYDDEGVYAGASQLFVQGILPYRDYFFAHPPIAAVAYAPAMIYHFTEWGSPTSFMDARYLSVAYSLVTLALLFLASYRLAGLWGALLTGGLWALDGRVIEINRKVMLDGPMVLMACAALLLYLWVRPALAGERVTGLPRRPMFVLGAAAFLGAMSALTKIAGAACLAAIVADLVWLHFDSRRLGLTLAQLRPQLVAMIYGALLAGVLCLGPFLVIAPSQVIRDIFFFQVLRPSDGLIDVPARISDIAATFGNALTAACAALGFAAMSTWLWQRRARDRSPGGESALGPLSPWRVIVLWTFFSLLLFTYSRSFYSHYYIQLAAPLCLLGAGVAALPGMVVRAASAKGLRWAGALLAAVLAVAGAPLAAVQWQGAHSRAHENRTFEIVGRYINDAVKPGTQVLTTDEQFNFLAARPPSRNATGYLVDSYGHMIFLGLRLDIRDWGDLIQASLRGTHGNDAYAIMHEPPGQEDFLSRAGATQLVVIHEKGVPRLTRETLNRIEANSEVVERQRNYTIYRVLRPGGFFPPQSETASLR